jgi:hypothetical protein
VSGGVATGLYGSTALSCIAVERCLRRRKRNRPRITRAMRTAPPMPAPIPAFAPVERPEEEGEEEEPEEVVVVLEGWRLECRMGEGRMPCLVS